MGRFALGIEERTADILRHWHAYSFSPPNLSNSLEIVAHHVQTLRAGFVFAYIDSRGNVRAEVSLAHRRSVMDHWETMGSFGASWIGPDDVVQPGELTRLALGALGSEWFVAGVCGDDITSVAALSPGSVSVCTVEASGVWSIGWNTEESSVSEIVGFDQNGNAIVTEALTIQWP
jgi:hypothetical protein